MDVQEGIVERLDNTAEYLARIRETVKAARDAGNIIIYIVVGFREGFPEVSPNNRSFNALKQSGQDHLIDPNPSIDLTAGDIVVRKHRVSAFSGSDLNMILRANGITHLVLSGIATSGVVLSTVVEAADKDYQLTVLSDLCSDFDDDVHDVLMSKYFPKRGDVITSQEWLKLS